MKAMIKKILVSAGTLLLLGGFMTTIPFNQDALACGWNNSGGQAFGPRGGNYNNFSQNQAISKEQAISIVTQHVKKLNPDLRVGTVNDAGPLYEAEVLSANEEEVLQIIGVYKMSGQVVVIN